MSENREKNITLFADFDGTIVSCDVGDAIFTKFMRSDLVQKGYHNKLIADWKAGLISSEQCLSLECAHAVISEEELQAELDSFTLTPGFVETASYCKNNRIPITILSDGLDYYINYILTKYGLNDIPFHSNHMHFNDRKMVVEFPFIEKGCGRCGNCKRWHIDRLRTDGDCVVYAGDGYSDRFAIKNADVVFARRDLAEYCRNNNLEYFPFDDFYPVLSFLENRNE